MDRDRHLRRLTFSSAFTLIELLIVILIVSILIAVAAPSFLGQTNKAHDSAAKQQLAVSYRAAKAATVTEVDQGSYPRPSVLATVIQDSEPQWPTTTGTAATALAGPAGTVTVDNASGGLTAVLHAKSGSGQLFTTVASRDAFYSGLTSSPATVSGNEISDATRLDALEGDGRQPNSTTGIWPAATNRVANGGFEAGSGGWTPYDVATATISQATERAKFGAKSLKVVVSGASGAETALTLSASTQYSYSSWVYDEAGGTYNLSLSDKVDQALSSGYTLSVPAGVWTRISFSGTTDATTSRWLSIRRQSAGTFYVDGVQVEQSAFTTPYIETAGSTATRAAARFQGPATLLSADQGWVAARVSVPWSSTSEPNSIPTVFDWRDSGTERITLWYQASQDRFVLETYNPTSEFAAQAKTLATGDTVTVIAAWTSSQLKVSVNGSTFSTGTRSNPVPDLATALFDVGRDAGSGAYFNGDFHWLAVGQSTLSNADAASIHAFGDADQLPTAFPGQSAGVWWGTGTTFLTP